MVGHIFGQQIPDPNSFPTQILDDFKTAWTVELYPYTFDCYTHVVEQGLGFSFEFQIIQGEEVTVQFFNPNGRQVQHDIKEYGHNFLDAKPGPYQFCFSNRHTNKKVITFEITENINDLMELEERNVGRISLSAIEEALGVRSVDKISNSIEKLQKNNKKMSSVQFYLKGRSRRDQYILENNLKRVNFWSCIYLFALMATAAIQITFIKSFFAETTGKIGL